MENEAIRDFLDRFEAKDCFLSDPKRFLSEMPAAFDANMNLLNPLFRGRFDAAFLKLEAQLKKRYITPETSPADEIRVTFLLNGTLHALRELKYGKKYDDALLAESIARMIQMYGGSLKGQAVPGGEMMTADAVDFRARL